MHKQTGLSLTETIILIAVISVSLSLGIPSFTSYYQKQKQQQQKHKLLNTLQLAKSQAIQKRSTVTVCASSSGNNCSGTWNDGILLFTDHNNNHKFDGADKPLRHVKIDKNNGLLEFKAFPSNKYLQFSATGMLTSNNGSFYYTSNTPGTSFKLIINKAGRIRIS